MKFKITIALPKKFHTAALPRPQEEEETDKSKQARTEQITN